MDDSRSYSERSFDEHEEIDQQCFASDSRRLMIWITLSLETFSYVHGGSDPKYSGSEISSKEKDDPLDKIVEMHLKVLEDLVSVNSLFTIAVFIGLSITTPNQPSLENRRRCDPDSAVVKTLVMFEVLSFSFFLVSSLAAKSLKVLLHIFQMEEQLKTKFRIKYYCPSLRTLFRSRQWRRAILLISTGASAIGVFFLTLSMYGVIQIKLGKFSCGSFNTTISVLSLTGLVAFSLTLYLSTMIYAAFIRFGDIRVFKTADYVYGQ